MCCDFLISRLVWLAAGGLHKPLQYWVSCICLTTYSIQLFCYYRQSLSVTPFQHPRLRVSSLALACRAFMEKGLKMGAGQTPCQVPFMAPYRTCWPLPLSRLHWQLTSEQRSTCLYLFRRCKCRHVVILLQTLPHFHTPATGARLSYMLQLSSYVF